MDLRYINTFHTIVEAGGFNKAAERLCYTQSTITFHVNQMEKELGVQLFEKAGRHMVLTKAGQELVPLAYPMHRLTIYQFMQLKQIRETVVLQLLQLVQNLMKMMAKSCRLFAIAMLKLV